MFLIVENDPQCPPGSCAGLLERAGLPWRTVAAHGGEPLPEPGGLTGVIVLGGEMSVYHNDNFPHLERVRQFMKEALAAGIPLLGICLGGQLLAQVAGGAVSSPSPHGEKGIGEVRLTEAGTLDPLFRRVGTPFTTFQLHSDSFSVPPGATLLADSPRCPAQAFRLGARCYGVQFHPEVDQAIVTDWCAFAEPPLDLVPGFLAAKAAFDTASQTIIANFIALASVSRLS